MSISFRTEPDKNEYRVYLRNGLLMMCDILGFSNLVNNSNCADLSKTIINIIDTLKIASKVEYIKMLNEHPTLSKKIPNWSETYELKHFVLSDTIIVYPNVDYDNKSNEYQVSLQLLATITKILFNHFLTDLKLLIRGAIVDGEYCLVEGHPMIYGKAVIRAHQYEKNQNWGGIILSPSISWDLKDSIVLDQSFYEDDEVPLKPDYLKEYVNISKNKSSIYVLNWVEDEVIINWDKIEESTKKIMNDKQLQDALEKIRNTKRFYYKIKSLKSI